MKPMTKTQIESPYLTMAEASEYLKFPTPNAFRMAVDRYGIPHMRIGAKRLFQKSHLDAYLKLHDGTRRKRGRKVA